MSGTPIPGPSTVPSVPTDKSRVLSHQRLTIRPGEVGTDGLTRVSLFDIPELVVGWGRGKGEHGVEPVTLDDEEICAPDLMGVSAFVGVPL